MPRKISRKARTLFQDTMAKERVISLIEMFLKNIVDPDNDEHFRLIFGAFLNGGIIGINQAADELLVSRPAISHWARGRNLPNRHLRPAIYQWLSEKATEHFRQQ